MYIDVKETIKKYFVVRTKEACGNKLAILGTHFEFKKILKGSWLLQMATCGRC